MARLIAHVKDRRPGVVVTLVLAAALAVPAAARAQNSISYPNGADTLTVSAESTGATVEYSAFRFLFCFPVACTPDYDVSSPQGFASVPAKCTDNGSEEADLDCDPVPDQTRVNGSDAADTVDGSCFFATSSLIADTRGGNDIVSTSCSGSDLDMGAGDDSVTLDASGTADGGDGGDTLTGGPGTNELLGGDDKDSLRGGGGNDVLDGGDGSDTLDGEAGNDVLRGGGRRDVLTGGPGADTLEGGDDLDTVSYEDKDGSQPVSITLGGGGGEPGEGDAIAGDVENAIGSLGADTIAGNGGPNDIVGLESGDVINPGGGPDLADGGPGNDRIEARDGAQDRIECGPGNDLAVTDAFDTVSGCEVVQASRELMPDIDADGIPAPADCDDRDARRRPGLIDTPGNGLDEDCRDGDAPFARIFSPVQSTFTARRRTTRVKRLRVLAVPEAGRIELRCRGGRKAGCFRKVRRFEAPRGANAKNLRRPLRKRRLKPRARLEVRILAPGSIGKVVRYHMRKRSRLPRSKTLCLVPGQRKPSRCPRG